MNGGFGYPSRTAISACVLVILTLVAAVGGFALAAANARYRLSEQAYAWNRTYFSLTADAERFMAVLETSISAAWQVAMTADDAEAQALYAHTLPTLLQDAGLSAYTWTTQADDDAYWAVLDIVFTATNGGQLYVSLGIKPFCRSVRGAEPETSYSVLAWLTDI